MKATILCDTTERRLWKEEGGYGSGVEIDTKEAQRLWESGDIGNSTTSFQRLAKFGFDWDLLDEFYSVN